MSATLISRNHDDYIELRKLPEFIPGRPNKSTVFRWVQSGVNAPDGERIRLRSTRIGGRIFARLADLEQFLARLNADHNDTPAETDADRLRRSREAAAALEAMGC